MLLVGLVRSLIERIYRDEHAVDVRLPRVHLLGPRHALVRAGGLALLPLARVPRVAFPVRCAHSCPGTISEDSYDVTTPLAVRFPPGHGTATSPICESRRQRIARSALPQLRPSNRALGAANDPDNVLVQLSKAELVEVAARERVVIEA